MAVYEYGGKTYELRDGLSNAEALSKIKTSLGETTTPVVTASPSQIPTEAGANLIPTQAVEPSFLDQYVRAPIETAANIATGMVGGTIGQGAGIVSSIFGGKYGTQAGIQQGEKTAADVSQALTYAPRGAAGQEMAGNVGTALGSLVAVPLPLLEGAARSLAPLARNPITTTRAAVAPAQEALAARTAQRAETVSALDYKNAARIDAVKAAQELPDPISFNPSQSNPTMGNKAATTIVGQAAVDKAIVSANKDKWANNAKVDLGIDKTKVLNNETYNTYITEKTDTYRQIADLGELTPTENTVVSIRNIKIPDLISSPGAEKAVQGMVVNTIKKIGGGLTGGQALNHIKALREEARVTLNAKSLGTDVSPSSVAKAQAKKAIADTLEGLIEDNVSTSHPELMADFRKARQDLAKAYAYKEATNLETGLLDPAKIPDNMTGLGATMRNIAANFPDAATVRPTEAGLVARLSRSGAGGTVGAALGSVTGFGGMLAGGIAGAAIGDVLGSAKARRIATPAYQAKNAIPLDRRIVPAVPVEPAGYAPNWQMGDQTPTPPRGMFPQLPAPSGEATRQMVINEQQRQGAMSRTLGQQQEAAQAAQEVAAGYGQRRAYQAPEAVTGQALPVEASIKTAAAKVAAGQLFDMTAAEKVAWNKTKVDLQDISPALKALDSKAIATKMADRVWVQETINKAQEKIKAFAEIEARAINLKAQREAQISREKMMETVQQLQDTLSARPVTRGQQGSVTRQFQQANPTNRLDVPMGFTDAEMKRR